MSPKARKGLGFGSIRSKDSQSGTSASLETTISRDQTIAHSAGGKGEVNNIGANQGSRKGKEIKNTSLFFILSFVVPSFGIVYLPLDVTVTSRKVHIIPGKEKPLPSKKSLSVPGKKLHSSKQVSTPKKTAGNPLFGSTSPEPVLLAPNIENDEPDSLKNVERNQCSDNDNGELSEAYHDTAEPLSEDGLQDLMTNNDDKPPSKKALKQKEKILEILERNTKHLKEKQLQEENQNQYTPVHCINARITSLKKELLHCVIITGTLLVTISNHKCVRPMRRRVRNDDSGKNRKVTFQYYLDVEGNRKRVCKSTFLGTLCISETFVRNITAKKMISPGSIIPEDGRGHHQPKHILSEEKKQAVMTHIESFPSYVSHYSRSQAKSLYFPSNLSYKKMYRLYKNTNYPYVSYSAYKRLAKSTGKKFKKNSKDQCGKCDRLKIEISLKEGDEKRKAEIELEVHHRKAEEACAIKRKLKKEALVNDNMRVLVYDLEQCLPTPMLRCGESYYTRHLNTFNLTVYDTKTKKTFCYMWHEGEGGRSANAIASCLLRHILQHVPDGVERLVLFSDACTSQNRNSHISSMYFVAFQEHASLKTVEHMFLVPGHTHMEPDNKHSVIERYKKTLEKVNVPQEWYDAVKAAGQQNDNDEFPS
ncbi:Zinc finger protein jing-like protein [Frankliniella fusca]|uniref:Zinc finger protein jing-like protein n=1 Tax=Frankliniella fusca TaxID=407009 RepID=A0AAE1LB11_9NEOP|nr:Zinc finger protein jing-like protein [Frankliniella fusca]